MIPFLLNASIGAVRPRRPVDVESRDRTRSGSSRRPRLHVWLADDLVSARAGRRRPRRRSQFREIAVTRRQGSQTAMEDRTASRVLG